jgi:ribose-phosphate pyrophosphokinase
MTVSIYKQKFSGGRVQLVPNTANKLFQMPGGEWHINGDALEGEHIAFVQGSSADDLMALAIWADAVHRDRGTPMALIPYLPGARQDRRLPGEALSTRVYADMINSMQLKRVVYLDPHSVAMPACLANGVEAALPPVVSAAVGDATLLVPFAGVIAPDAGAAKRAAAVAELFGVPCFQALKHRDPKTGKLSGFSCETLPPAGRLLIVDDICDGGGTFKGLAEATGLPRERLALYVSHGIFSKGAETLDKHFSAIYTTDAHPSTLYAPPITHRASVLQLMQDYL